MPIAPHPSAELLSPSQRFNPPELVPPAATARCSPGGRVRAGLLPPPPSLPPARLLGCGERDGASPTRCRERRRAAQRARGGRPAAPRLSRSRSRRLWASGIGTPGFKPAGIREVQERERILLIVSSTSYLQGNEEQHELNEVLLNVRDRSCYSHFSQKEWNKVQKVRSRRWTTCSITQWKTARAKLAFLQLRKPQACLYAAAAASATTSGHMGLSDLAFSLVSQVQLAKNCNSTHTISPRIFIKT
ncbi:uncharacterized protein LOC127469345 [Manacus candei]|uniref:uncharacterized protein LOC127469345 n=1 Tax=Manacus candei TaxID=415023 RepID=UPI002227EF1C|nr:uncharacterized protein LOC127469345 [Manacus candei]